MPNTGLLLLAKCIAIYLVGINIVSVIVTISDKRRARRYEWRISEKTLLLLGFLGGAIGEFITMLLIRHKTKHLKFMILLPIFIVLHFAILFYCFLYLC